MSRLAPRRILLTTDAVGGVWHYTAALARAWTAMGLAPVVAVLGPRHGTADDAAGLEIVATDLALDWLAPDAACIEEAAYALARLARRLGAETLHLHSPSYAAFDLGRPAVAVAHSCVATWWRAVRGGAMPQVVAWRAALARRGLTRANAVLAPSAAFADLLRDTYNLARPIHTVHHGAPRDAAPPGARQTYVLTAGRLWDEGKNMAMLDAAAGAVAVPVYAAGALAGPEGGAFRPRHLRALGPVSSPAMRRLQSEAALFAAPSRYEPFGLAVLEAAALGTPLLLADIPTFRELWDGAAEFLPCDAPAAWAAAIQRLLADEPRRASLGARARARAARHDLSAMASATWQAHRAVHAAAELAPA